MASLLEHCRGFVYLLARTGITGEQETAPEIGPRLADIRSRSSLPVACGFGISRPEHVAAVTEGPGGADAAIVGSALVRRMRDAADPVAEAERFTAELATGLRSKTGA